MESPNKKKSKFGVKSTIGGELGGSYKTASPYNIKTTNMTNGLSPLMQAAIGGEKQTIPGQQIIKDGDDFYYDTGGDDQIYLEDPDGIIAKNTSEDGLVGAVDFVFEETEDGYYKVTGGEGESVDPDAPGTPGEPGYEPPVSPEDMIPSRIPGGVGGPMQMASPYKNYKNPQEYKAFNFGNKPTPFNKYKKGKY